MGKADYKTGSSTIEGFFNWINERHMIYLKKEITKAPFPWTEDPILRDYKFTNAFRQLDKGTLRLTAMLGKFRQESEDCDIVWTIVWYRMFNFYVHADWVMKQRRLPDIKTLDEYLRGLHYADQQVFTGAHLTCGRPGEDKLDTHLDSLYDVWPERRDITQRIKDDGTMKGTFKILKEIFCVGPFIAYEMTCDLRFWIIPDAPDKLTWANIGPGAKRGLERLGLPVTQDSLQKLFAMRAEYLKPHVSELFELREIEHSLCEFDKYERVRNGEGRPRQMYSHKG